MMSLVMSGGSAESGGVKGGVVGASGSDSVDTGGGDGVVVGAEGAYPVEIGFTSGRDGETETDEGATAEEIARKKSRRRGRAGKGSGLGSWAADFGLFVSQDGKKENKGADQFEINSLAEWGVFEASLPVKNKERQGGNDDGESAGLGQAVVVVGADGTGATGADAAKVATKDTRPRVAEDPVGGGGPRSATEAAGVDGATDLGDAGMAAPRAPEKSKREPSGFFDGLRDMRGDGGDQDAADLEAAARVAGGELYALDDRLSVLAVLLEERPLAANGKGAASASAAAGEVTWLRSVLKTGEFSDLFRRPGEVRRAAEAVERSVRGAERAVERDVALLDDAGALTASWCRSRDTFPTRNLARLKNGVVYETAVIIITHQLVDDFLPYVALSMRSYPRSDFANLAHSNALAPPHGQTPTTPGRNTPRSGPL